jgi:glycosyltransferase involved in cell wall biosynthesis
MSVLFFTCWYPSKENPYQGVFIKEHATAIYKSGVSIQVLALDIQPGKQLYQKSIEQKVDASGISTHTIQIKSKYYKWIYSIPFLMKKIVSNYIEENIAIEDVKVLHSNVLFPCGVVGYQLNKKYGWRHIHTEHWSKMDRFIDKHLFGYLGKKTLQAVQSISVVSNFLKQKVEKYVLDTSKISVIPNVIDHSLFFIDENKKNDLDVVTFTAVATWKSPKCPIYFMGALTKIQAKSSQKIVLNMVGDGPLLEEIKAKKHNFQIHFLGKKTKEEISNLLRESTFFLHASHIETFSVVIAEALFCGVPVIASNVGAIPELIFDFNGVLCDNKVESWVAGIEKALSSTYNRTDIANKAFSAYNQTKVGEAFKALYK